MTMDELVYRNYVLNIGFDTLYKNEKTLPASLPFEVRDCRLSMSFGGPDEDLVFIPTAEEFDRIKDKLSDHFSDSNNPSKYRDNMYIWLATPQGVENRVKLVRDGNKRTDTYSFYSDRDRVAKDSEQAFCVRVIVRIPDKLLPKLCDGELITIKFNHGSQSKDFLILASYGLAVLLTCVVPEDVMPFDTAGGTNYMTSSIRLYVCDSYSTYSFIDSNGKEIK